MKSTIYFLAGVISCTAAVLMLWYFGALSNSLLDSFARTDSTNVIVVSESPSPTHDYVAVMRTVGNGEGWCERRLNVDKSGAPSDWEHDFVFITGCGNDVAMKWEGDHALTVYYAYDNEGAVETYQQYRSPDKAVEISYVPNQ